MTYFDNGFARLYQADARHLPIPDNSVDCVVTSPPYWGLRDYGLEEQGIGLEQTPEEYCTNMVEVFREVWRVLKPTGTVWLNLGDSYSSKDLVGIPWRVAFALQADGWYLRSDIIWSKPNPMPEPVRDRPTKSHEYVFLLTKSPRYYYDADAIREEAVAERWGGHKPMNLNNTKDTNGVFKGLSRERDMMPSHRNKRSVWEIATHPYPEAHFATYPEKLVEPCILAGTSEKGVCAECGKPWEREVEKSPYTPPLVYDGSRNVDASRQDKTRKLSGKQYNEQAHTTTIGWQPTCECNADTVPATVLDPFAGSGTTLAVAQRLGRKSIGTDLSEEYLKLASKRLGAISMPMILA